MTRETASGGPTQWFEEEEQKSSLRIHLFFGKTLLWHGGSIFNM